MAFLGLFVFQGFNSGAVDAQTFSAARVDGRPGTQTFDPIIDESTFAAVNSSSNNNAGSVGGNINGPSIIRVPDWIPDSERVHPTAQYYMYFANHRGQDIRMAWADSLTGDWTLFNAAGGSGSTNIDRAWGVDGNNTGTQTPNHGVLTMLGGRVTVDNGDPDTDFVASNHIASPEVIVDHVNQRIAMNFHATTQFTGGPGQGTGQVSFVTTSKYGLDFNPSSAGSVTDTTTAAVIASWDNWDDVNGDLDADTTAGFSAFLSGDAIRDIQDSEGSIDGTFGSLISPAASTTNRRLRLEKTGLTGIDPVPHEGTIRTLTATVTNNTGEDTQMSGVFFDLFSTNGTYKSWAVEQNGVVLASGGPINEDVWTNADVTFEPIEIANGETVQLDVVFSGATNGNSSSLLDNFAITTGTVTTGTGTTDPELHGMREVITARAYVRSFQVGGQTFAFTNEGELWKAPATNDAGEVNTIDNADSEGGLWNPSGTNTTAAWWEKTVSSDNPLSQLYVANGQAAEDVRHAGTYTRTHIDPNDTNVYVFFSARDDTPEAIFLTVIDTNNGSTNTSDWQAIGQRLILQAELEWEGGNLPPTTSVNGAEINVNQVRDPLVFEDDQGTADQSDDKLYLFYTGQGEEGIGFAELTFDANSSNTTGQQGDLLRLLGDVNLDGVVNFLDISPFISLLSVGEYLTEADVNEDGLVNFLDISPFIGVLSSQN